MANERYEKKNGRKISSVPLRCAWRSNATETIPRIRTNLPVAMITQATDVLGKQFVICWYGHNTLALKLRIIVPVAMRMWCFQHQVHLQWHVANVFVLLSTDYCHSQHVSTHSRAYIGNRLSTFAIVIFHIVKFYFSLSLALVTSKVAR